MLYYPVARVVHPLTPIHHLGIVTFIVLHALDMLSTGVLVSALGPRIEANPICAWIMRVYSVPALAAFKFTMIGIALWAYFLLSPRSRWVLWATNVAMCFVVANNLRYVAMMVKIMRMVA